MNDLQRNQYNERERIRRYNMSDLERDIYLQSERERYHNRVQNMNHTNIEHMRHQQTRQQQERRHGSVLNIIVVEPFHIGNMDISCGYCGALRFENEPLICCHNDEVNLPT